MAFPLLIPSCAATRHNCNLVADNCTAVALERIKQDGSPTHPFPLHQVSTGSSLTVHQALPTAPSARTGVPDKHAQGLHSSSEDDDEPPQLVSGGFEGGDTMAAMCIERMERNLQGHSIRTSCNLLGARAGSGQGSSSQSRGTLYQSGS
jgi:hypothetical protein